MKSPVAGICLLLFSLPLHAQSIQLGETRRSATQGHVLLLSDSVQVEAGKSQVVELRFRVDQGFHINSHAPKDELLIPTVLMLDPSRDIQVSDEQYQKGTPFRLTLPSGGEAGETLDVYQGEFRVSLRILAPKGVSTLTGSLHYQACDNEACFPPKTLPVMISVTRN